MCKDGFLKPRETAFLESATRTRHLDWALLHLSRTIERRRDRWAQALARGIQPVMALCIGLLVGFICVALFLPLVKLVADLS